jgi:phage gp16-like protein
MSPKTTAAPRRTAGTTRRQLLATMHCLKKTAGWDDDTYRDILQAKSGARSCTDLDFAGLERAVKVISAEVNRLHPAAARAANEWAFIDTSTEQKQPVLRKICAICRSLGTGKAYAEGVARKQSAGVERRLEMMTYHELYRLAGALARTQGSKQDQAARAARQAAVTSATTGGAA